MCSLVCCSILQRKNFNIVKPCWSLGAMYVYSCINAWLASAEHLLRVGRVLCLKKVINNLQQPQMTRCEHNYQKRQKVQCRVVQDEALRGGSERLLLSSGVGGWALSNERNWRGRSWGRQQRATGQQPNISITVRLMAVGSSLLLIVRRAWS